MIELEENSTKFLLMFMVANSNSELEDAIKEHKQLLKMKKEAQTKKKADQIDLRNVDYSQIKERLKKHIPMLSDNQFDRAVKSCKQQPEKINSQSDLIQCIIDHL